MLGKNENIDFYRYIISWSLQIYKEISMKILKYIYIYIYIYMRWKLIKPYEMLEITQKMIEK